MTLFSKNGSSFRVSTGGWLGKDGNWRVMVGSKRGNMEIAILFISKDFSNWIKSKYPLHSSKDTEMWECPNFLLVLKIGIFRVNTSLSSDKIKHVLKVSWDDKKQDSYL